MLNKNFKIEMYNDEDSMSTVLIDTDNTLGKTYSKIEITDSIKLRYKSVELGNITIGHNSYIGCIIKHPDWCVMYRDQTNEFMSFCMDINNIESKGKSINQLILEDCSVENLYELAIKISMLNEADYLMDLRNIDKRLAGIYAYLSKCNILYISTNYWSLNASLGLELDEYE